MESVDRRIEIANLLQEFDGTFASNYQVIKTLWKEYFDITLKDLGISDQVSIDILFNDWDMENWGAMHKENTEYKHSTIAEMYDSFSAEADYISDRISFDRIFRTHWLYRQVFYYDINKEWHTLTS